MTSFEPGQILLVRFPFTEIARAKKRPALVLLRSDFRRFCLYTVAMITSSEGLEGHTSDIRMADWEKVGLPHASTIRLAKLATIDGELVEKPLHKIGPADAEKVRKQLRKTFKFWL